MKIPYTKKRDWSSSYWPSNPMEEKEILKLNEATRQSPKQEGTRNDDDQDDLNKKKLNYNKPT